jgi:glutamine synthetase
MTKPLILPAISKYTAILAKTVSEKKAAFEKADVKFETEIFKKLNTTLKKLYADSEKLTLSLSAIPGKTPIEKAEYFKNNVLSLMESMRTYIDSAEEIMPSEMWPVPAYKDIIFKV